MNFNRTIPKLAAIVAASSIGLTACSDEQSTGSIARLTNTPVTLEVSSVNAKRGDRIAVAVNIDAAPATVGGIQGTIEFDAARLTYIGQSPIGDAITVVNNKGAAKGALRFLSGNPMGVKGRVATFVFETRGDNYFSSIRYVHHKAASAMGNVHAMSVTLRGTTIVSDLSVPSDAAMMTIADWAARLVPTGGKSDAVAAGPGEYRLNLQYGNVDFNSTIDVNDFLAVANAAVGNDQIIIGTDGPAVDVDLVIAGNVFPTNLAGACGTEADGTRVIDLSDFLAVANRAVGNPETCAGTVIPGRGPLPTTRQLISATSTPSLTVGSGQTLTLTKDRVWEIGGQLRVLDGGTLNIQEGTRVEGVSTVTAAAIFIERGGRINAIGTQNEPIVMTCTAAVKTEGCWGGVFVAGRAPINTGDPALGLAPDGGLQRGGEGGGPLYGGINPTDNSGVIRYVRIEFAGFLLSPNNELNGLTLGGVGSGTQVDHVQIHAGQDDGLEFFGGTVSTSYIVLTGNDDDQFDISFGNSADHQFVIIQSDVGAANNDSKAIEADGNEPAPGTALLPRTSPRLWNFTIIGNLSSPLQAAAVQLRRGSGLRLYNSVIAGWPVGADFDDDLTCDAFGDGSIEIKNTTFVGVPNLGNNDSDPASCGGGTEAEEALIRSTTAKFSNNVETAATITTIFRDAYNTQLPDFRMLFVGGQPALGNTLAPSSIPGSTAVATNYRGAVAPSAGGTIPWYAGWTRGFTTPTTP